MILPLYIADLMYWSANWQDYTARDEVVKFDPIPTRVIEKEEGSRYEITRGDTPRVWIKTPALSRIAETPMFRLKARPLDHPMTTGKVLLHAGETSSARCARIVLFSARSGHEGYRFVDAPKEVPEVVTLTEEQLIAADRDLFERGRDTTRKLTDAQLDAEIAACDRMIARAKARTAVAHAHVPAKLPFGSQLNLWGPEARP